MDTPTLAAGQITGTPPQRTAASPVVPLSRDERQALSRLFRQWPQMVSPQQGVASLPPLLLDLLDFDSGAPGDGRALSALIGRDASLQARLSALALLRAGADAGAGVPDADALVGSLGPAATASAAMVELFRAWTRRWSTTTDRALLGALWQEYVVAAFCSREIAVELGDGGVSPDLAFAAGLVHDLGTLLLCGAEPALMSRFIRSGYGHGTGLNREFVEAHSELGAAMLAQCGAPAALCDVAARHHEGFSPEESALAMVVCVADHMHAHVVIRSRGRLVVRKELPAGCFPDAGYALEDVLLAMGLQSGVTDILLRVAGEGALIRHLSPDPA
jgi:hypothetical protein